MVFRKTANEYVKSPVGVISDYSGLEGTVIDSQGNVYQMDGLNYIKIGYDIPALDTYVKYIPKIGFGVAVANAFAPKWGKREDRGWLEIIIGFIIALYVLLAFEIFSWIGYQILTQFAKPILNYTEDKLYLRRFLPCVWFMENPDKNQMSIARGAVMFLPYLLLFIIWCNLLSACVLEGVGAIALIVPIFTIISAVATFVNYKINKSNLI